MESPIAIAPLRIKRLVRSAYFYPLLIVIIVGGFLRFHRVSDRGIFIHDEAHFLNVVRTFHDGLGWLLENRAELLDGNRTIGEARGYLLDRGGSLYCTAKHGHVASQAIFSLLYGLRPTTGVVLSGIFGTATLLLIFALGKSVYDVRTGLLASASLASSAVFLKYSRSGLAQADSIFFAYLGVIFYFLSRGRKQNRTLFLGLAGLSLGIAFTCHYNVAYVLLFLVSAELLLPQKRSIRAPVQLGSASAALILAGSFCVYLLLFDIPFELASLGMKEIYPGFYSYFGDLRYHWLQYHAGSQALGAAGSRFVLDDPLYFIRVLILQEGLAPTILIFCAFCFFAAKLVREPSHEDFIFIMLFLIPLAVWSFYSFRVERSFIIIIPAAAIMLGQVFSQVIDRLKMSERAQQLATIGTIAIILCFGYFKAQENVLHEKTNFDDGARLALNYAVRTGGVINESAFSWHTAPVWRFYLAYYADRRPDSSEAWRLLNLGGKQKSDILLLDPITRKDDDFERDRAGGTVIATIPATPNLGAIFICDIRGAALLNRAEKLKQSKE